MHVDCKGLQDEELQKAKSEIPMGKMQRAVDMFSYQTLRRIYISSVEITDYQNGIFSVNL